MSQSRNPVILSSMSVLIVICLFPLPVHAQYSGGTGEPNDPYQIATAADLIALGNEPNDYGQCFVLTADLNLDPNLPGNRVFDRAVIAPDANGTAPYFQGPAFTGVLDGGGHAIAGLVVDSDINFAGLFGMIGIGGRVCNLRLVGGSVRGQASTNRESGTGGLAGINRGLITACCSTGSVRGTDWACGGLVGQNDNGIISACYSMSTVSSEAETDLGGLVGYNSGMVWSCYCRGSVSGTGGWRVAGLVAANSGTISACYCTGWVGGTSNCFGGLAGQNYGTISTSFWDIETSGQATSAGGTGLTTTQMMAAQTFAGTGWDFLDETANGLCEYWQMPVGGGYPVLSVFNGHVPHALRGAGTANDPHLLETAEDLGAVWYSATACYRLAADIDLSGIKWGMALIPAFSGKLDGQGHRIAKMTIAGGGRLGLIGSLSQGAAVKDLGLEDVNNLGTDDVGALVACNEGGRISTCHSNGSVRGERRVGGLVGSNDGTILASSSAVSVNGNAFVGGLAGDNRDGNISACRSLGSVSGTNGQCGGLAGGNGGTISACCSTGSVSSAAGSSVGGFVGGNSGTISACCSTGPVSGVMFVGGLVGSNSGPISACYSTGSVSGSKYSAGGLVAFDTGRISASFWDIKTSGQTKSDGGAGLTTSQMVARQTFVDAGWDFLGERANGLCEFWEMPSGGGYPELSIFHGYVLPVFQGTGTSNDPYLIGTAEDLAAVWYDPMACYQLAGDIDLSGITWGMAVVPAFSGSLDGKEHRITGMTIDGGVDLGLMGLLRQGAAVKNLGLEDANVVGTRDVGTLAGRSDGGSILACYSTGSVVGQSDVGGLVGWSRNGTMVACHSTCSVSSVEGFGVGGLVGLNFGMISACFSTGSVGGVKSAGVGGLVGRSSGSISACYSEGAVSGDEYVGGLVGFGDNTMISACYSTGAVTGNNYVGGLVGRHVSTSSSDGRISIGGTISDCFWDIVTSAQTASAGGTGKTTTEMKTARTFLDAGWDFVGETANGSADLWWIDEGHDYPRLWWETHD